MGRDSLTEDQRIEVFNSERGLLNDKNYNFKNAYDMLKEELDEFMEAYLEGNTMDMLDALADLVVVSKGEMLKLNYSPRLIMDETLKEIEDRTGAINPVTGKWQKKLRGDEYKADYRKARND